MDGRQFIADAVEQGAAAVVAAGRLEHWAVSDSCRISTGLR